MQYAADSHQLRACDPHLTIMSDSDDALLARLNALKQSSVSLDSAPKAPAIDVEAARPVTVEDKLADRLRSLRAGASPEPAKFKGKDATSSLIAQTQDEVRSESHEELRDWQQDGGDEQSLEELLAELAPEEQWALDPEDPKHINSLLREAKDALPEKADEEAQEKTAEGYVLVEPEAQQDDDGGEKKTEDQQDDEEADEYVKQVLAQLDVENKYGLDAGQEETKDAPTDKSTFDLPSTPSNLPAPPSYDDSELEARFAGLQLPSTPTTVPSSKKLTTKTKSGTPKYTDEDIDSWCCICNEDGEVKCLGCDGDIYCQNCWKDGHGNKPGQERGHRAVQYGKGRPAPG